MGVKFLNSNIINGKEIAAKLLKNLSKEIQITKSKYNKTPLLAIILVGGNDASLVYVKNKIKAAENVGIKTILCRYDNSVTQVDLLLKIDELNFDINVSGIIVQLPLPSHIQNAVILQAISPEKDVDGFHPLNVGYLFSDIARGFVPCTAMGCLNLIKSAKADLTGANAVIIGRSNIVGKPLAALLLKQNCTVTICHSKTINLATITKAADIIVAAVGVPKLITLEHVSENSIVIDVGISRNTDSGNLIGDVDFVNVRKKVKYLTPVPGGVGPMTVAYLMLNTYQAFQNQIFQKQIL